MYSDTSAGCFGDIGHVNLFSDFVNTNGYVTDGRTSTPLKGIRQIVASSAVNWQVSPSIVTSFRGILLLRDRKGFVTFLLNDGPGGNLVDSNNNVVDPLDPTRALQGAVEVAQGGAQACALMGPLYRRPNAVVCFAAAGVSYLGAKLTLDSTTFPFGPSLISVDGRSNYMRATSLSVGYVHTCATVGSAEVLCWGATVLGQLAGTPVDDITVTTSVISDAFGTAVAITTFDSGVQSVSCGGAHTCVVLTDADDVGVVRCWGNDGTGPTNSSSLSVYALNENVRYSDGSNRALTGVTSLSAGNAATCVTLGVNEAVTCECRVLASCCRLISVCVYAGTRECVHACACAGWGADHVFSDAYGNVYDYAEYTLGDGGAAGRSDTGPKSGATTLELWRNPLRTNSRKSPSLHIPAIVLGHTESPVFVHNGWWTIGGYSAG